MNDRYWPKAGIELPTTLSHIQVDHLSQMTCSLCNQMRRIAVVYLAALALQT